MSADEKPTTTSESNEQLSNTEAPITKEEARVNTTVETTPATTKGTEEVVSSKPQLQVKTYSEAEVEQRVATVKGGYEGTTKKMKDDLAKSRADYDALQDQIEELKFNSLLQRTEEEGGDMNAARQLVDLQKQLRTKDKELRTATSNLVAERERLESLASGLNAAQVKILAKELVGKHGLSEDDLPKLLKAETPEQMRTTALELEVEKLRTNQTPTTTVEKSKASGKAGVDLSKMKPEQRIQFILDHNL